MSPGTRKTKIPLRENIWFTRIDSFVKEIIASAVGRPNPPEPLRMTEMPSAPSSLVP